MEYYIAIKKNEIMSFVGKLKELEIIMLIKLSQAEKDIYYLFPHTCRVYILKRE
jgi:hypothetical protein